MPVLDSPAFFGLSGHFFASVCPLLPVSLRDCPPLPKLRCLLVNLDLFWEHFSLYWAWPTLSALRPFFAFCSLSVFCFLLDTPGPPNFFFSSSSNGPAFLPDTPNFLPPPFLGIFVGSAQSTRPSAFAAIHFGRSYWPLPLLRLNLSPERAEYLLPQGFRVKSHR